MTDLSEAKRFASPQAWRRLRQTMTIGELTDIAMDIAQDASDGTQEDFIRLSDRIARALVSVQWEKRKQA